MVYKIKTLRDISQYQLCCGCGLCAYLDPESVTMIDNPLEGRRPLFLEPEDEEACSASFSCCPGYRLEKKKVPEGQQSNGALRNHWGPVLALWEGYAVDPEVRFKGSSGGVATALALFTVETGQAYGVLHVRAKRQNPVYNEAVLNRSRDSILSAAGSRYSPASPCEKLSLVESASKPCLIIGKPCDIAAVHNASDIRPRLRENIFLTVACFCAGTPSTAGTLQMLKAMGISEADSLVGLRYRGYGWPGEAEAQSQADGFIKHASMPYEQSWGDILQKYRQWRCCICPDHTGEFADISLGDPWYRKPAQGESGRSLIIARTRRGQAVIEAMIEQGYLCADSADPAMLPDSQPNLLKAHSRVWGQLIALRVLGLPHPNFKGFPSRDLWFRNLNAREKLQSVIGTVKRVVVRKVYRRTAAIVE